MPDQSTVFPPEVHDDIADGPDVTCLTSDAGVRKQILQIGRGDPVPLHARCLVHYVASLAQSCEVFMDTRKESAGGEPMQIVAGRDASLREVGLNLAVGSMLRGERSKFFVAPEYGFGQRGSFSFPAVPPNAHLIYEVELIEFEPPDEVKTSTSMMYEDRLEVAERRRLEGNALFTQGQFIDALGKYAMALSHMNEDFLMQLEGAHLDKANAVRLPILLNSAACHLRLQDHNSCISSCSQVLTMDKGNVKALYRRGKARHQLGQTSEAEADVKAALLLAPEDRLLCAEMAAIQNSLRADRQAQSRMFKGRLNSANPGPAILREQDRQQLWLARIFWQCVLGLQGCIISLVSFGRKQ